ncbi:MAG: hypothetical protein JO297_01795, partial [Nitrososphaeraceae archaeon]|nr:hypothetical protein [Nitrososphaeraceae archaeon]
SYAIIVAIGIFGLTSSIILITTNSFLSQFQAAAFVAQYVHTGSNNVVSRNAQNVHDAASNNNNNNNNDVTIISGPVYSWIFKDVFNEAHVFSHYRDSSQPIQTKIILVADSTYRYTISNSILKTEVEDKNQIERLQKIYNSTDTITTFVDKVVPFDFHSYPYISLRDCVFFNIEVKVNY